MARNNMIISPITAIANVTLYISLTLLSIVLESCDQFSLMVSSSMFATQQYPRMQIKKRAITQKKSYTQESSKKLTFEVSLSIIIKLTQPSMRDTLIMIANTQKIRMGLFLQRYWSQTKCFTLARVHTIRPKQMKTSQKEVMSRYSFCFTLIYWPLIIS